MVFSGDLSATPRAKKWELALVVDARTYDQLTWLAVQRDIDPSAVAAWLVETSLQFFEVRDGFGQSAGAGVPSSELIGELSRRIEAFERGGTAGRSMTLNDIAEGRPVRTAKLPGGGHHGGGLHHEIVRVLEEAGRPMGAGEIAAAIRHRGSYQAPRSAKPVTGATISSRVSNPQYRDLFGHSDRKITLAE